MRVKGRPEAGSVAAFRQLRVDAEAGLDSATNYSLEEARAAFQRVGLLNTAAAQGALSKAHLNALHEAQAAEQLITPQRVGATEPQLLRSIIRTIAMEIDSNGSIDIGGGVRVERIAILKDERAFEEKLRFRLLQPDLKKKVIAGPLQTFVGCMNLKEIVLRALHIVREEEEECRRIGRRRRREQL